MKEISVEELKLNPSTLIGKEWALLTAGNKDGYNTMTVSWGQMGELWNKPTTVVYIRPQRYTKEFVDKSDYYTLSFLPDGHRDAQSSARIRAEMRISLQRPTLQALQRTITLI